MRGSTARRNGEYVVVQRENTLCVDIAAERGCTIQPLPSHMRKPSAVGKQRAKRANPLLRASRR
jgi:hypothetical protein